MSGPCDKEGDGADLVLTPAGLVPRGHVHPVGPGEAIRRNDDGTYSVVPAHAIDEAEGREVMPDTLVLTPGGYRRQSSVHEIEPGSILDGSGRAHRQLNLAGAVLANFGPVALRPRGVALMPANVTTLAAIDRLGLSGLRRAIDTSARPPIAPGPTPSGEVPALGSGWITYASWTNSTGTPVSRFATTWVVPPEPVTRGAQTIFLFNGIQNSTMIYQPVLQWGLSAAGGGPYWAVASWYADGQTGHSFHSKLIKVNVGDTLVGVMTLTSHTGADFNYNCEFQGIANTGLTIQNVEELTWCIETLEAYEVNLATDYPNTLKTEMRGIEIKVGSAEASLRWSANNAVTDVGQHTSVVSNASPGGQVELWYRYLVKGPFSDLVTLPNGKIYVIFGNQYIRYSDSNASTPDAGYPKPIAGNWGNLPPEFLTGFDSIATLPNGKTYATRGGRYVRYSDPNASTVDAGYPKPIAGNWGNLPPEFLTGFDSIATLPNGKTYIDPRRTLRALLRRQREHRRPRLPEAHRGQLGQPPARVPHGLRRHGDAAQRQDVHHPRRTLRALLRR